MAPKPQPKTIISKARKETDGGAETARERAEDVEESFDDSYAGTASVLSQLAYKRLPRQKDVINCIFEEKITSSVLPITTESSICEFYVEPSSGYSISLFDSFFSFDLKFTHADDSPLDDKEPVGIVPFPLCSIFKFCRIFINGQLISSSTSSCFAYESYIASNCMLNEETKKYMLGAGLLYPDYHKAAFDIDNGWSLPADSNFHIRASKIANSKTLHLLGRIPFELFLSKELLCDNTEVRIQFGLNPVSFILVAKEAVAYKMHLLDARFFLCKYLLSPQAVARQHAILNSRGLCYDYPFWETRIVSMPAGLQFLSVEILRGNIPDKITLAIQTQAAAVDCKQNLNPLHFTPQRLSSFQLKINDVPRPCIPYSLSYVKNASKVWGEKGFYIYLRETNLNNPSFSMDNWLSGMSVFTVDCSSDHSANYRSAYLSQLPAGSVRADVKFEEPLTESLVLMFINEYRAEMILSAQKRVTVTV